MLDLTTRTSSKKLYEIKMPDGKVLNLKLPTQSLLMRIQDMTVYNGDMKQMLDVMGNLVTQILNNNVEGVKYTKEQIMDMLDLDMTVLVIKDYFEKTTKTLGE